MSVKWPVTAAAAAMARADEVGASAVALTAFKVTVGSGGAALTRSEAVGIHGEAH